MLAKQEYLVNPCGSASLPYWKLMNISIPDHLHITHHSGCPPRPNRGDIYFRLCHDLRHINSPVLAADYCISTASPADADEIASMINASYPDCKVNRQEVLGWTRTPVYCPNLWIFVEDTVASIPVACGIADFDPDIGELILEWIQVLPDYRRQGIGTALVQALLCRRSSQALFATVSGNAFNVSHPEALYRKCGFTGQDYWHVWSDPEKKGLSHA